MKKLIAIPNTTREDESKSTWGEESMAEVLRDLETTQKSTTVLKLTFERIPEP